MDKYKVEVQLSDQAKTLLLEMPDVDIEKLKEWKANQQAIVGGRDLIEYLTEKDG